MKDSNNIGAIILAAGKSHRMGQNKALLTIKNETFLEREVSLFRDFGTTNIVVVTGYNAEEIRPVISQLNVNEIYNPSPSEGMFSSVCRGVKYIAPLCDAFFILPTDIPLIRRCTLDLLFKSWLNNKRHVAIPSFENQSGHPSLFPSEIAADLLNWNGKEGIQGFLKNFKNSIINVFTPNEHMLLDIDTPQDYANLETYIKYIDIPTHKECISLLDHYSVESKIKAHSVSVSLLATAITKKLNESGVHINLQLVESASLLHDIARTEKNHDKKGAQILDGLGFSNIALIVSSHMSMCVKDSDPITAAEIVFVADKYTLEDSFVNIEERYNLKMKEYKNDIIIKNNIENKLNCALKAKKRIEKLIGQSIISLSSELMR